MTNPSRPTLPPSLESPPYSLSADLISPYLVQAPNAVWTQLDSLPSEILDHIAWGFKVDSWSDVYPIETKRNLLRTALSDKRIKGTRFAVEKAITALGSSAVLTEWWEMTPAGPPHTFTVQIALRDIPGFSPIETQNAVIAAIEAAKPARSHFTFELVLTVEASVYFGAWYRPVSFTPFVANLRNNKV